MNAKDELQQFNDVVLISKQKCISLVNSENPIDSKKSIPLLESNSTKENNVDHASDNKLLDSQVKNSELQTRMPNIKVFSGKMIMLLKRIA